MNLFQPPTSGPPSSHPAPSGLTSVGSILASIGITKRKLKKLDVVAHAWDAGHRHRQAYSARPFVLCGIPVRRPHRSRRWCRGQFSTPKAKKDGRVGMSSEFRRVVVEFRDQRLLNANNKKSLTSISDELGFPGMPFHRLRLSPFTGRVSSCIAIFEGCSVFAHVTACRFAESPL
jgi:hypothetical protein